MTDQFYEKEARQKILQGAEKLYDAVKTTLGPRGRNVVIGSRYASPTVTHDGVTVANAVEVRDEAENIGAKLIKEAANKLNDTAGDGTTTVTVLTYHMLKQAHELLESNPDINPMILARELESASKEVLKYLESQKLPSDSLETLERIATISSADPEIGKVVADTIFKIGATGTVTVEPTAKPTTTAQLVDGVVVERGWATPQMVTDPAKMQSIYDDVPVLIIEDPVHSFLEILPLLDKIVEAKYTELVIVAEDFEGDVLPTILLNNRSGAFRTLAVMAPSFEDHKRHLLDDLAVATGATVVSNDTVSIKDADASVLGHAKRVVSTKDKTVFTGVSGDPDARIKRLQTERTLAEDKYDQELLDQRIALLSGKIASILVGGQTESEVEEKKFRVDDAVAATKAALLEGVLPGGGITLYHAPITATTDGAKLLASVLKEPFKQLLKNSAIEIDTDKVTKEKGMGVNVKTGKVVNLVDEGIVDPYAVTKQALITAVSLGVVGLTAGALIVEEKEESK